MLPRSAISKRPWKTGGGPAGVGDVDGIALRAIAGVADPAARCVRAGLLVPHATRDNAQSATSHAAGRRERGTARWYQCGCQGNAKTVGGGQKSVAPWQRDIYGARLPVRPTQPPRAAVEACPEAR